MRISQCKAYRPLTWVVSLAFALAVPTAAQTQGVAIQEQADSGVALGEDQPIAVLSIAGYESLLADIEFVGNLVERPGLPQMMEGMLALFTGGKGLAGLDKTQPWGVVLQSDGTGFAPMAFIPVTNLDKLIGAFEPLAADGLRDLGNGVYEVAGGPQPAFIKAQGGFAFIVQDEAQLDNLPADPLAQLGDLPQKYDLALRVNVQEVPEVYRTMALENLRAGLEEGLRQEEEESDAQFAARRQIAESQIQQLEMLIAGADQATLGWQVDAANEKTYLDAVLTAVPGSKLASQAALMKDRPSRFAGFFDDNATVRMYGVNQAGNPEDVQQAQQMLRTFQQQAVRMLKDEENLSAASREAIGSALDDLVAVLNQTLEEGEFDMAAMAVLSPETMTLATGGVIADGLRVEEALKKIDVLREDYPEFPGVQWNADTHRGVRFHEAAIPVPEDEGRARKLLGDNVEISVGVAEKAIYFALGADATATLKRGIDKSRNQAGKVLPPGGMVISIGKLIQFLASLDPNDELDALARIFPKFAGQDHVNLITSGVPGGFRYRMEVESGVLKAVGQMAAEQMNQQQGAGF